MGDVTGSTVYLVTGNCRDYYCGCGNSSGHLLGVAATIGDAERIRAEAVAATEPQSSTLNAYCDVTVEPIELPFRRREEP